MALQLLSVHSLKSMLADADRGDVERPQHDAAGVVACVEAVRSLLALVQVQSELSLRLDSLTQQQLASIMTQQQQLVFL